MTTIEDAQLTNRVAIRMYAATGSVPPIATVQDLRLAILEGYDPSPEEMLAIVDSIRRDRRAAARPAPTVGGAARTTKARTQATPPEDLKALLDQSLGDASG